MGYIVIDDEELEELMKIFRSKEKNIQISEPALLLRINQRYHEKITDDELYEITRGEWVVGMRRNHARYAFAVYKGIVLQVYKIEGWFPYSGKTPSTYQRWCFDGVVAENLQHYVGGSVRHYFRRGAANPVTYINC